MIINVREIAKERSMKSLKQIQALIDASILKNGKPERTLETASIKELLTNNKPK